MGPTVVGKPAATVITSSPGLSRRSPSFGDVSVATASKLAEDPEFTINASPTPMKSARRLSNSSVKRPEVSQKSRTASVARQSSSGPKTRPA